MKLLINEAEAIGENSGRVTVAARLFLVQGQRSMNREPRGLVLLSAQSRISYSIRPTRVIID